MATQKFDYIIIGAGLSGLQLAKGFLEDSHFQSLSIAIIDKSSKSENDKTWCFWETQSHIWDSIVYHKWSQAKVYGKDSEITLTLAPYQYKMIRSVDFYNSILGRITTSTHITFINDDILGIDINSDTNPTLLGKTTNYTAQHVFDSRIPKSFYKDTKATTLLQHFKGWIIETQEAHFNPEEFTMMDYRLVYKNTTSFTYVLPFTKHKALVEYTFFSPNLVDDGVYDTQLKEYITKILAITNYKITQTEQGVIPMTDYNFSKHHSKHITLIGTAGGWVKGSSGYSFKNTQKNIIQIIENLKKNDDVTKNIRSRKFNFYDAIFLKVLKDDNAFGPKLFERFYSGNKISTSFKFLDEDTTIKEDIGIIWSLKSFRFIKAFFKHLFN